MMIKAFGFDYNWKPEGGAAAEPGTYRNANPIKIVNWTKELGANLIQTYCVSYNGYAWYPSKIAPVETGLDENFLHKMIEVSNLNNIRAIGYFCLGANPHYENKHPELTRPHTKQGAEDFRLVLNDEYLNYFCSLVNETLTLTSIEGFMIDWFRHPMRKREKWIKSEKEWYGKIMGEKFPINAELPDKDRLVYEKAAIEYAWKKIKGCVEETRKAIIWTNHPFEYNRERNEVVDQSIWDNNLLLKEADWILNESGNLEILEYLSLQSGQETKIIQNLCGWKEHDANIWKKIDTAKYGLYGFSAVDPKTCLSTIGTRDYDNVLKVKEAFRTIQ